MEGSSCHEKSSAGKIQDSGAPQLPMARNNRVKISHQAMALRANSPHSPASLSTRATLTWNSQAKLGQCAPGMLNERTS